MATLLRSLRPNGVSLVLVVGLSVPHAPVGSFNPIRSGAPSLAQNVAENQLAGHHIPWGEERVTSAEYRLRASYNAVSASMLPSFLLGECTNHLWDTTLVKMN